MSKGGEGVSLGKGDSGRDLGCVGLEKCCIRVVLLVCAACWVLICIAHTAAVWAHGLGCLRLWQLADPRCGCGGLAAAASMHTTPLLCL